MLGILGAGIIAFQHPELRLALAVVLTIFIPLIIYLLVLLQQIKSKR